jgi:hypothetical protein
MDQAVNESREYFWPRDGISLKRLTDSLKAVYEPEKLKNPNEEPVCDLDGNTFHVMLNEKFYQPENIHMSDFKTRLVQERTELSDKVGKLDSFMNSESFSNIEVKQQELLRIQLHLMKSYEWVLNQRINLL